MNIKDQKDEIHTPNTLFWFVCFFSIDIPVI